MPAVAAITLNDGQATPVAHTFSPSGPDKNGVHYFYDRSGGFPIGFPSISISLKEPKIAGPGLVASNQNRVYRAQIQVVVPIMEVGASNSTSTGIAPAPTKSYECVFRGEFILPERSSLACRKDALAYVKNILAHSFGSSLIQDLESVYG
jgi:hypothetical protein